MKKSLFILFCVFLAVGQTSARAALEKDLGQALPYLRVTDAQADLPAVLKLIEHQPVFVLDLRAVVSDRDFAEALQAALDKKPAPHALRLLLLNGATAPFIIKALDADFIDTVTLGPKAAGIKPDVEVAISETDDRKAYEALASGTPVEKLVSDSHDKRRYDEAKLVHDHANGITPADEELPADAEDDSVVAEPTEGKKTAETAKKAAPAPVLDLVLERAIQLHRSLLALKKL